MICNKDDLIKIWTQSLEAVIDVVAARITLPLMVWKRIIKWVPSQKYLMHLNKLEHLPKILILLHYMPGLSLFYFTIVKYIVMSDMWHPRPSRNLDTLPAFSLSTPLYVKEIVQYISFYIENVIRDGILNFWWKTTEM